MTISLSKEDRTLCVRVDMEEARSAVENLWNLVNSMAKIGHAEFAQVAHNALLMVIAEAIVAHVSQSSAEQTDALADDKPVVH